MQVGFLIMCFESYLQFRDHYILIIMMGINMIVKMRVSGHTYCGFVLRGQHSVANRLHSKSTAFVLET